MKVPKKSTKKTVCAVCDGQFAAKEGKDWIGCDGCSKWFHVDCAKFDVNVYIEMLRLEQDQEPSLWLCSECLPALANNWPSTTHASATSCATIPPKANDPPAKVGHIDKRPDPDRQSITQHFSNLRLLETKLAESIKKIESFSPPAASNLGATKWGPSGVRADNYNRLIITNMPVTGEPLIARILRMARRIGCDLQAVDIDQCNQIMSRHQSGAMPVFVRFVQRWKRDEFYSLYLHSTRERLLIVGDVFGQCSDDTRRMYVSEHLTPADNVVYREARRMKKRGLIRGTRTRSGCVFVLPLNVEREKYVGSVGELVTLANDQDTQIRTDADASYYFDADDSKLFI
jgi:hypothetical protein